MSIRFTALLLACVLWSSPAPAQPQQPAATTNSSVTIASNAAFQTVLAAGIRRGLTVQNNNTTTDNCWIYIGVPPGGNTFAQTKSQSVLLAAGQAYTRYYPYIPSDEIRATCATAGNTLYVDTQ